MKAVNLHLLTRIQDPEALSLLYQALSGQPGEHRISTHEAASLVSLVCFLERVPGILPDRVRLLDGFFFSYVIEHIGKEFDLLKVSSNGSCVLNIELKSEDIGEQRIRKQLEQNRYYLSHSFDNIFSFTYVMETDTLYCLHEKGYLQQRPVEDLLSVLMRPSLQDFLSEGIDRFFRSSDYLISPVAVPERFLQGQYFLTNQQFDFRRRTLEHLKEESCPVVSITGSAGTGKTLLLFDLALSLSRKNPLLLIHSGPLRQGHLLIDERLKNVEIRSSGSLPKELQLSGYTCLLVDEADHLASSLLEKLLAAARECRIPVILASDPHQLLNEMLPYETPQDTAALIERSATLSLAFTGNIRINRPVYSFLRTLLHRKDHAGHPDYGCIDVIYASAKEELPPIVRYYTERGYLWIRSDSGRALSASLIAQEYEKILLVLDEEYEYDDTMHLRVKTGEETRLRFLYECLSRTRENLCLVVLGNQELFLQILEIRQNTLS